MFSSAFYNPVGTSIWSDALVFFVLFCAAEEKAREAESKRVALEARLGEDVSKESRVNQRWCFGVFVRRYMVMSLNMILNPFFYI